MMHIELQEKPHGQVLVLLALGLLALMAVVALSVDGGHVYSERRRMQNAADAGALAGAYELCYGSGTAADAESQARTYALNNGAEGADVQVSGLVSVTVVATETARTYFAGLIGFREVPVQADATANCGQTTGGAGIWPVGFDGTHWKKHEADLECWDIVIVWEGDAGKADCKDSPTDPDGFNCCYLWTDQNNTTKIEGVDLCDGGAPKLMPLDGRAWLDYSAGLVGNDPCDSATGIGADEIKYRMEGENNKGEPCLSIVNEGCYARPQGETASAWKAAESAAERIVKLPLYDPCQSGTVGQEPIGTQDGTCEIGTTDVCTIDDTSGGNERFWIYDFACIQIGMEYPADSGQWFTTARVYEDPGPLEDNKAGWHRVLVATIPCDENGNPPDECEAKQGSTDGEGVTPGSVPAISLSD